MQENNVGSRNNGFNINVTEDDNKILDIMDNNVVVDSSVGINNNKNNNNEASFNPSVNIKDTYGWNARSQADGFQSQAPAHSEINAYGSNANDNNFDIELEEDSSMKEKEEEENGENEENKGY